MRSAIVFTIIAVAVAGCTTSQIVKSNYAEEPGQTAAGITGTVDLSNPLLKALKGGLIGGTIGAQLGPADRSRALQAEYKALEYSPAGKPVDWADPDTGAHGEVSAAQPYQVGSQNCRQYTHTVFVNGVPQSARGTACRNQDGSWTPLS